MSTAITFKNFFFPLFLTWVFTISAYSQSNWQDIYLVSDCQCSTYRIQFPNEKIQKLFRTDSSGRIIWGKEIEVGFGTTIDSFFYNLNGQLRLKKMFRESNGQLFLKAKEEYNYSAKGMLVQVKHENANGAKSQQDIEWDQMNRLRLLNTRYFEKGNVPEEYNLKIKFQTDTIALIEYGDHRISVRGKRFYNTKGKVVKEFLENSGKGKRVHFQYKYSKDGKIRSISKVKVVGGDIILDDNSYHQMLLDPLRKVEFEYDSRGRVIKHITYEGLKLDKFNVVRFLYED